MPTELTRAEMDQVQALSQLSRQLKREITEMTRLIEGANHTISVAKLTLAHIELAARNGSKPS